MRPCGVLVSNYYLITRNVWKHASEQSCTSTKFIRFSSESGGYVIGPQPTVPPNCRLLPRWAKCTEPRLITSVALGWEPDHNERAAAILVRYAEQIRKQYN